MHIAPLQMIYQSISGPVLCKIEALKKYFHKAPPPQVTLYIQYKIHLYKTKYVIGYKRCVKAQTERKISLTKSHSGYIIILYSSQGEIKMNVFSDTHLHSVSCANVNFYTVPFVHPRRTMCEHDFIYLLQGEWEIAQNEESFSLCDDTLLILFANETHAGTTPCREGTKTMYFHVSLEDGDIFDPSEQCGIETLINAGGNPNIKALFENVVNAKLSGEQRKADLFFELLLCELKNPKTNSKEMGFAQKIKDIIHNNPEKFFSNEELAQMTNVSVKTAETKFKAAFGKTIHRYIMEFKIREARSYFDKFDGISVKEVAYNLGFCDEYHFSKQFSHLVGVSPSHYKKLGKLK